MALKHILLYIFLLCGSANLFAQNLTHLGILPKINYHKTLNEHFSLNFTSFSEIDVADNTLENVVLPSRVINFTFIGGVAYKLRLNSILTAGYLFRVNDPFLSDTRFEHRFISQFVQIQHIESLRLRHHLRFEERFIEAPNNGGFNAVTRLSYTLGWDIPLQGKHLDANEFYINSVNSIFVQPTRPRTSLHNLTEIYLGLGYKSEKFGRFEIGPEAKMNVRNSDRDLNTIVFIDFVWFPNFKKKK